MKFTVPLSALALAAATCAGTLAQSSQTASGVSSGPASTQHAGPAARSAAGRPPTSGKLPVVTKLLVIWEENHTTSAYAGMPYLASLAGTYGKATHYIGVVHPSLGNYLAATSGQGAGTCGLRDPSPAACPQPGRTVFGQALGAGRTAKAYAETMTSNCKKTNNAGYVAHHNPWVYFPAEAAACGRGDVPLSSSTSALRTDARAGSLPNAGMIIPNMTDDAHNGTLAQADSWLRNWLPVVMAGPDYQAGRLAVVVVFDEGTTSQTVPFVVVNARESHRVVSGSFNHYSLCRLYDDVLGVAPLNRAAGAPGLAAAFGL
jgi:phosphatidylinositol-3-phosphatase